ncbi:hypothetical protein CDIK_2338 [Cucumispora dikerogammari]|nr:hypothetical protein CDIK_2338 [Cucumispora dikerogammari]
MSFFKTQFKQRGVCLILDNARIHKEAEILKIAHSYGHTHKFLFPYSYMLNPIEKAFSKIKLSVRSRLSIGDFVSLSELIHSSLTTITAADCSSYFRYMHRNITNCAAGTSYLHQ